MLRGTKPTQEKPRINPKILTSLKLSRPHKFRRVLRWPQKRKWPERSCVTTWKGTERTPSSCLILECTWIYLTKISITLTNSRDSRRYLGSTRLSSWLLAKLLESWHCSIRSRERQGSSASVSVTLQLSINNLSRGSSKVWKRENRKLSLSLSKSYLLWFIKAEIRSKR